jgi:hypothetical protein
LDVLSGQEKREVGCVKWTGEKRSWMDHVEVGKGGGWFTGSGRLIPALGYTVTGNREKRVEEPRFTPFRSSSSPHLYCIRYDFFQPDFQPSKWSTHDLSSYSINHSELNLVPTQPAASTVGYNLFQLVLRNHTCSMLPFNKLHLWSQVGLLALYSQYATTDFSLSLRSRIQWFHLTLQPSQWR